MATPTVFNTEVKIQKALQEKEGGTAEVETPIGYIDLLTDEYVIEIKHIIDWKDGVKVLALARYFPDKKPRLHLFGHYVPRTRQLVEETLTDLGITATWEENAS
jgi:hypothetical protein